MVLRGKNTSWFAITLPIILILVLVAFAWPLLWQILNGRAWLRVSEWKDQGGHPPFFRTTFYALATTLTQVSLGFIMAVILRRLQSHVLARSLSLLFVPALIGGIVISFIYKSLLWDSTFLRQRPPLLTWATMVAIQNWQYVPMFTYLFWLRLQSLPKDIKDFATVQHLTPLERLYYILWPHCRNLAAILALFALLHGYQEYAKFHLILAPGPETCVELISHWLTRQFRSYAQINPAVGISKTLSFGAIFLVLTLAIVAIVLLVVTKCGDLLIAAYSRFGRMSSLKNSAGVAHALAVLTIVVAVAPLFALFRWFSWREFVGLNILVTPLITTVVVALIVVSLTIVFGICIRIVLPDTLQRFDTRSLPVFICLLMLHAIPAIGLAFCAYHWLKYVDQHNDVIVFCCWIVGQCILALPYLAVFTLYINFTTTATEIRFLRVCQANTTEIAKVSFWGRLWPYYMLLFLFAFSLIWFEDTLNLVLSSRSIPSVADELRRLYEGRASNYPQAVSLVFISLIPVSIGIWIWDRLVSRSVCRRLMA